jgi:hypothetical protein
LFFLIIITLCSCYRDERQDWKLKWFNPWQIIKNADICFPYISLYVHHIKIYLNKIYNKWWYPQFILQINLLHYELFERNAHVCKLFVRRRSSLTITKICSTPTNYAVKVRPISYKSGSTNGRKKCDVILSLHASCRDRKINVPCLYQSIFLMCVCVWARIGLHIVREE